MGCRRAPAHDELIRNAVIRDSGASALLAMSKSSETSDFCEDVDDDKKDVETDLDKLLNELSLDEHLEKDLHRRTLHSLA